MKRYLFVAAVVCAMTLGSFATSHAWLIDTNATVNTNSHNDSSTNVGDRSSYMRNNYNQRYDNRQDKSVHAYDSFNTDSHNFTDNRQDRSIKDSYNDYANKSNNSVNDSYNKSATTGDVRNSVLGDFNQLYSGTDFRSGVTGSGNTIDTSSVNITTLGDTPAK